MTSSNVSICILTFNHEKFIKDTLSGVLKQNINHKINLIISDDCSSDNTVKICEEVLSLQDKIPYSIFSSNQRVGVIKNFVKALSKCNGKYVAYCEGDDYWTDDKKLQKQIDFLEEHLNYSFVFHDVEVKGNFVQERYCGSINDSFNAIDIASGNVSIPMLSLVYRNREIDFSFLNPKLEIGDFPLIVYLAQYGPAKYIPEVMGVRRVHENGVWSALDKEKKLYLMLKTLSIMIGYYNDEINEYLLKYQLRIIANSIKENIIPNVYPPEIKSIAKRFMLINNLRLILRKTVLRRFLPSSVLL